MSEFNGKPYDETDLFDRFINGKMVSIPDNQTYLEKLSLIQ